MRTEGEAEANTNNLPLIIKSSLVFLDFNTINQSVDIFSGAFAFQNSK